jgi:hypothetical protein
MSLCERRLKFFELACGEGREKLTFSDKLAGDKAEIYLLQSKCGAISPLLSPHERLVVDCGVI